MFFSCVDPFSIRGFVAPRELRNPANHTFERKVKVQSCTLLLNLTESAVAAVLEPPRMSTPPRSSALIQLARLGGVVDGSLILTRSHTWIVADDRGVVDVRGGYSTDAAAASVRFSPDQKQREALDLYR